MIILPNLKGVIDKAKNITYKILAGGTFTTIYTNMLRLGRLNADGTADAFSPSFNSGLNAVAVQSDGKFVCGGTFTDACSVICNRIARINTDGTLDSSFTIGTGFNSIVYAIAIQSDGKIICGGNFTSYNGTTSNYITRLNTDGTLDSSFYIGTGFNGIVSAIAIQSDGKILVGGAFTTYNGTTSNRIARLNTDGTLDSTVGTGFSNSVSAIAIQSDGKILVGGSFITYNGTASNYITRINTDGTLDSSFITGTAFNGTVLAIAIQSDGKILVGGAFTTNGTTSNRIARLNTDGTLDSSFTVGTGFSSSVYAIAIQSDGKIICVGNFTSYNGTAINRIARLNTDGTLDSSFTIGSGFNSGLRTIVVLSDGRIICGGLFTSYNATTNNRITRINTAGIEDSSFIIGIGFNLQVSTIAVQSDGKILVGGYFTTYNGTTSNRIARLNTDGTLDSSFTIGTGFNDVVNAIVVLSDGRIICGGAFTSYNGVTASYTSRMVRLATDGTLESQSNAQFNNTINAITRQSDDKFVSGGFFTSITSVTPTYSYIARHSVLGIDLSFYGSPNGQVNAIAVQSDGKILVGGYFTTYNGTASNYITRINTDGTLDSSFITGTGFNGAVLAIAIQSDGKIICGGAFTSYNGTAINRIARLNTDGTLDSSFTVGTGFLNTVYAIAIQADGKILVGGIFLGYNGFSINCLVRLKADGTFDHFPLRGPSTIVLAIGLTS